MMACAPNKINIVHGGGRDIGDSDVVVGCKKGVDAVRAIRPRRGISGGEDEE